MTMAQDGGKVVSLTHRTPLPPGNAPGTTGPRCPKGFRKLRFPDYMTMAQNGGKVVSLTHRPFYPQVIFLVLISVRG
jgi:hypothetical protein